MSDPEDSGNLRQIARILGDTSGYVAALVTYLTLITGNLPGRFPKTAAILGVVITSSLLWAWRWSRITRQRSGREPKTQAAASRRPGSSILKQLIAPLVASSKDTYSMSLAQRRVEVSVLLVLTIFAVGWSGSNLPGIIREFNPPPYSLTPPCTGEQDGLRVVIADFYETSSNEILFEERLYDEMSKHSRSDVQICRLKKVIPDRTQVLTAQAATRSTVFIWGRSDRDAVDVHLEVSGWEILAEDIWSFQNDVAEFQAREASHLTFLTQYSFSLIRYVNGQYAEARDELETASENATNQAWVKENDNITDLANAHFLLGLIYEDDNSLPELNRLAIAKTKYDTAILLQPDSDSSILNRGRVCMALDKLDCAMEDFTKLIDRNSALALDAYINRAYLQPTKELIEHDLSAAIKLDPAQGYLVRGEARLGWGDVEGALTDLKIAREFTPGDPYLLHSLGKAQLLSGDFDGAIQTYNDILPYLDSGTRDYFIEELNMLEPPVGAVTYFQETVRQIETILNEATLP